MRLQQRRALVLLTTEDTGKLCSLNRDAASRPRNLSGTSSAREFRWRCQKGGAGCVVDQELSREFCVGQRVLAGHGEYLFLRGSVSFAFYGAYLFLPSVVSGAPGIPVFA